MERGNSVASHVLFCYNDDRRDLDDNLFILAKNTFDFGLFFYQTSP